LLDRGNCQIIEFRLEVGINQRVMEIRFGLFLKVDIFNTCEIGFVSGGLVRVGYIVPVVVDFGMGVVVAIWFFLIVHFLIGNKFKSKFDPLYVSNLFFFTTYSDRYF
jgi:hypothetical protein